MGETRYDFDDQDDEERYFDADALEREQDLDFDFDSSDCHQCGTCPDCAAATQRYFVDQRRESAERVLARLQDVLTQHGMRDKLDASVREALVEVLVEELP